MAARRALLVLPLLFLALASGWLVWAMAGNERPRAVLDVQPLTTYAFPVLGNEGGALRIQELNGEPALLNVWCSWCGPCRVEHPFLMELHGRGGIRLLGLNYLDKPADALGFLEEFGDP